MARGSLPPALAVFARLLLVVALAGACCCPGHCDLTLCAGSGECNDSICPSGQTLPVGKCPRYGSPESSCNNIGCDCDDGAKKFCVTAIKLPGIEQIAYGYNLAQMAPSTKRVLAMTYKPGQVHMVPSVCGNTSLLIPDGVTVVSTPAADFTNKTRSYSKFSDFLNNARIQMGIQADINDTGDYRLNAALQHIKLMMSSDNILKSRIMVGITISTELYKANYASKQVCIVVYRWNYTHKNRNRPHTLTRPCFQLDPDFISQIKDLPQHLYDNDVLGRQKYMQLYNDFGTHYIPSTFFGGLLGQRGYGESKWVKTVTTDEFRNDFALWFKMYSLHEHGKWNPTKVKEMTAHTLV
jgi:hypothetical protein